MLDDGEKHGKCNHYLRVNEVKAFDIDFLVLLKLFPKEEACALTES